MTKPQKPAKPSPDFPLFPDSNGQWAKKIKGKKRYFGVWADPVAALRRYHESIDQAPAAEPETIKLPRSKKPAKPRPDFPLFAHASGQWAKKIRRKIHYFGPLADPQAALDKYLAEKDHLLAGRTPTPAETGTLVTIDYAINRFLYSKKLDVQAGYNSPRTFHGYKDVCERLLKIVDREKAVSHFTPTDFEHIRAELAKYRGITSLGNDITRIRMIFKYAHDQELIEKAVRFGQGFKKPPKIAQRRARLAKGPVMFQADEIRRMLDTAHYKLKAMILLGINCGFGNDDCARLPMSAVKLDTGWIEHPRPKTGIQRRSPLWPETVEALRAVIKRRNASKVAPEYRDRVFFTNKHGVYDGSERDQPISKEFRKLVKELGIHRKGVGFYALRHTFQTIGEAKSETVTEFLMGHAPASEDMSAIYREQITDAKLKSVASFVRQWLFKRTALRVVADAEASLADESAA